MKIIDKLACPIDYNCTLCKNHFKNKCMKNYTITVNLRILMASRLFKTQRYTEGYTKIYLNTFTSHDFIKCEDYESN